MNLFKRVFFMLFAIAVIQACSSGKAALKKGDYYDAVLESVHRLRDSPTNKKATAVLTQREWLFISKPQPYLFSAARRAFVHSVLMILVCSGLTRMGLRQTA